MTCHLCATRPTPAHYGSPRGCWFDSPARNWNCETVGGIREIVYEGTPLPGVDYRYCDDMKYATVRLDERGNADAELPSGRAMALWVAWYKSRGGTDAMWLLDSEGPPRQPTEADCLAICAMFGVEP